MGRMGASIDTSVDMFDILNPRPEGLLQITVHRTDGNYEEDAYFKVRSGASAWCSDLGQSLLVFVWLPKQQSVEITFHNQSDSIGRLKLSVLEMISWGLQEQTLEITDESSENDQGLARISAKWMSLNLDNPVL